ncbi:MAG: Uma2 family endonuclease [Armatimonadetes bacterium]|nr:Uma2 family endonuclease [Armatimonadota bacterium]
MAAEAGIFKSSERLELINGEVYEQVSPQSSLHAWSILISAEVLRRTFGPGYMVREEKPILISDESEPEPDIAVVKGSPGDFQDHPRPESLALVMEVSESSLAVDTRFKSSLYASEGIPDYWVLNLKQRNLEVRREPYPNPEAPFGYSYKQIHIYTESDRVTPLFAPEGEIQVKDLLPPLPEEAGSGPQTEGTESE